MLERGECWRGVGAGEGWVLESGGCWRRVGAGER